jgi:hypothetical protein
MPSLIVGAGVDGVGAAPPVESPVPAVAARVRVSSLLVGLSVNVVFIALSPLKIALSVKSLYEAESPFWSTK